MSDTPLEHALKQCKLYPLLIITSRVLSRAGFGDIQIMDRRTAKGKTRFGGFELLAEATFATLPIKTVIKVIPDSIRIRMLDEAAGASIRTGADLALVVTSKHVTRQAARNLLEYQATRVAVLDGKALAELMTKFKIGVRASGEVDYAFFGALDDETNWFLSVLDKHKA